MGGDGVKGAPDIEEGGQAMGPGINVALNVVNKGRGRSFGRAITAKPVLLGVEGTELDTLIDVPGAKPLKHLQKVVGEGDRAVGGRLGVGVFARFGKKNHRIFLPKTGRVPKIEAGLVNNTEHVQYVRGEVQEENGLEAVGAQGLLGLKV